MIKGLEKLVESLLNEGKTVARWNKEHKAPPYKTIPIPCSEEDLYKLEPYLSKYFGKTRGGPKASLGDAYDWWGKVYKVNNWDVGSYMSNITPEQIIFVEKLGRAVSDFVRDSDDNDRDLSPGEERQLRKLGALLQKQQKTKGRKDESTELNRVRHLAGMSPLTETEIDDFDYDDDEDEIIMSVPDMTVEELTNTVEGIDQSLTAMYDAILAGDTRPYIQGNTEIKHNLEFALPGALGNLQQEGEISYGQYKQALNYLGSLVARLEKCEDLIGDAGSPFMPGSATIH